MNPVPILAAQLATLAIVAAGLCVMVGLRPLALRLFTVGVVLATGAGMSVRAISETQAPLGLFDQSLAWSAVIGVCAAIWNRKRLAIFLIAPTAIRWLGFPVVAGVLSNLSAGWRVFAIVVCTLVAISLIAAITDRHAAGILPRTARIFISILGAIVTGILELVGWLFRRLELQALVRFHLRRGGRADR